MRVDFLVKAHFLGWVHEHVLCVTFFFEGQAASVFIYLPVLLVHVKLCCFFMHVMSFINFKRTELCREALL